MWEEFLYDVWDKFIDNNRINLTANSFNLPVLEVENHYKNPNNKAELLD